MSEQEDVKALAAEVRALAPADQLRLAACLIDRGRLDVAERIVDMVRIKLRAERLFGKSRRTA